MTHPESQPNGTHDTTATVRQRSASHCGAMQYNAIQRITKQHSTMEGKVGEGADGSKIRATKQIQAQDQTFTKHHTRHIHKHAGEPADYTKHKTYKYA